MNEPVKRPVRPRDAASLVIIRGEGADTEVLMGQRARRHKFMPDMYVFPGGRLDTVDSTAPVLKDLPEKPLRRLTVQSGEKIARGLAVAAARETWEETGLVLGKVTDQGLLADLSGMDYMARAITPPPSPIRFHARFFIADAEQIEGGPDAPLGGSGELLDLAFRPLRESLEMPIADVTEFVLEEVLRRVRGTSIEAIPMFSYSGNAPVIRYQNLDRE
jgi:8-oxo-dGTP pyrophosphatase MutT (NUDIX family)